MASEDRATPKPAAPMAPFDHRPRLGLPIHPWHSHALLPGPPSAGCWRPLLPPSIGRIRPGDSAAAGRDGNLAAIWGLGLNWGSLPRLIRMPAIHPRQEEELW
jgi:hypothetical protein